MNVEIEWKCDVCGEIRPDKNIEVFSVDISHRYGMQRGTIQQNTNFCSDKVTCVEGSKEIHLIGEKE